MKKLNLPIFSFSSEIGEIGTILTLAIIIIMIGGIFLGIKLNKKPSRIASKAAVTCPTEGDSAGSNISCDGVINGVDYSRWLNTQCIPGTGKVCSSFGADFNQDGRVDDTDYNIWIQYHNT